MALSSVLVFSEYEPEVTISPWVTRRQGTDVVAARVNVDCHPAHDERQASIRVSAEFRQLGRLPHHVVVDSVRCHHDRPTSVFVVSRGAGNDAPGLGEVKVSATARVSDESVFYSSSEVAAQVVDEGALAAAIEEQLAGPNGPTVRAELEQAIRDRIASDPPFLGELLSALG